MNFSYWEHTTWFSDIDYSIIGSGIVGLSTALHLKEKHPNSKIVVFESGILPSGASTKNAGFACFGSVSEILDDLSNHTEQEAIDLIRLRYEGLHWLKDTLGAVNINYQGLGGHEVFTSKDRELFENCIEKLPYVNDLAKEAIFSKKDVFSIKSNPFSFKNTQKQLIFNHFEGQIDTGKMMNELIRKCQKKSVFILNSIKIDSFLEENDHVLLKNSVFNDILTKNVIVATNGFSKMLFPDKDIEPARAQVLITNRIPNLTIQGTFHLYKGYYYFRNIDDRILLGGGRNLDFSSENTQQMETTPLIQNALEELLATTILPKTPFTVANRWSGIMGVGQQKSPIVEKISKRVTCAIRLGGMGVAIGGMIGKQAAKLAS